jgi:CBS-domain-containing membrane protein
MLTKAKPAPALTAVDVMSRAVLAIPRRMALRDAARLLWRAGVGAAPVVDEQGRCVGLLSAVDFLRWAEEGCPAAGDGPVPCCRYQEKGRLLGGGEAALCTLPAGGCPLQSARATAAGRQALVCLQPTGVLCDWQQVPDGSVEGHMTSEVITASPTAPLAELARLMTGARVHRVPVLDDRGRPVGMVSTTDVLAAVAREWLAPKEVSHDQP